MSDNKRMTPRRALLDRLVEHATKLGAAADIQDAEIVVMRALLDLLPMDSVVLVRMHRDGTLQPRISMGPLGDALMRVPTEGLRDLIDLWRPEAVWRASCDPADEVGSLTHDLSRAGVRSAAAVGIIALGTMRGMIVLGSARPVALSDDDALVLRLFSSMTGTAFRAAMLVPHLRQHAATDTLTGLGNRAAFNDALEAPGGDVTRALILIDVDGFKRCNDELGHVAGDRVLVALGRALAGAVRQSDAVFRIGGDEFTALVAVQCAADALEMGRRLHEAVVRAETGVTVSIGIALERAGEPNTELRDRADSAMYRVKAAGHDGVAIDEPSPGPVGYDVAA